MDDDNKKAKRILEQLRDCLSGKDPVEALLNHSESDTRYAVLVMHPITGQLAISTETIMNVCDRSKCESIAKELQEGSGSSYAEAFIMSYRHALTAILAEDVLRRKLANVTDSESIKTIIN